MTLRAAVDWKEIDLYFIQKNFPVMTWDKLLSEINDIRPDSMQINLSALRHQVRRMGLTKGIQIRWSAEDIDFLKNNYQKYGNIELAERLTKFKRSFRLIDGKRVYREFNKKHVEKKIKLLSLVRSPEELKSIQQRNFKTRPRQGFTSDWNLWSRGIKKSYKEGNVVIWKGKRRIKVNGKFTPYTRWLYQNTIAKIPAGHIVYHLDCDTLNDNPNNLVLGPRKGLNSAERYEQAIPLLKERENSILNELPTLSSDKYREQKKQLHTDLNRIRRLLSSIESKLEKRRTLTKKILIKGNRH
jgi:hypothetical protein